MACSWQPLSLLRPNSNPRRPEHLGKEPTQWTVRPAGTTRANGLVLGQSPAGRQWQTIFQGLSHSAGSFCSQEPDRLSWPQLISFLTP